MTCSLSNRMKQLRSQVDSALPCREQFFLLVPQMIVYLAAALLVFGPLATGPGVLAALAGAVLGVLVAWRVAASHVRVPAVMLAAIVLSGGAMLFGHVLGQSTLFARCFGTTLTPWLLDALMFGTVTFSVITVLRVLTETFRVCAVLEMAVLGGSVILTFLPHRDLHLGQPRDFSDWVFAGGHDPVCMLMGVGILTIGTLILVVQRWGSARRLLQSAGVLVGLLLVAAWSVSLLPAGVFQPEPENSSSGPDVLPPGEKDDKRPGEESPENSEPSEHHPERDGQTPPRQPEPWPQPADAAGRSDRPVALVEIDAEYRPHQRAWYFRQNACSVFNGRRLVRSAADLDPDVPSEFPVEQIVIPGVPRPDDSSAIVPSRVYLLDEQSRPFGLVSPVAFDALDNPDPDYFRMAYKVESRVLAVPVPEDGEAVDADRSPLAPLLSLPAGNRDWSEEMRAVYLYGPDDPRYRELADQILQDAGLWEKADQSPLAAVLAIGQWIAKNTTYSSRVDHSAAADPTASFLFGSRRGYCVHIAHSMVYLCRARGIPARAATGFAVDVGRASRTNTMMVIGTDAHAWPEIYLQGVGWVVVDTSPEKVDPHEPQPSPPDRATEQFLHDIANKPDNPVPFEPRSRFSLPLPSWPWLLGVAVLTLYGIKFWRRFCPHYVNDSDLHRVCLRRILDQLAEIGIRRRFGETREAFAARVTLVPELEHLTRAHVAKAIGASELLPGDRWRETTHQAAQRIVEVSTRTQQIFAWLNPVAWLLVR